MSVVTVVQPILHKLCTSQCDLQLKHIASIYRIYVHIIVRFYLRTLYKLQTQSFEVVTMTTGSPYP